MNTVWSDYIQRIGTLYKTRSLRFDDRYMDLYKRAFAIDDKHSVLEIGCGPGALTQSIHKWYPDLKVTGSDRDTNFIKFAKSQAPDIDFVEADATALPFLENSFDVTISNTVQEHIAPDKFFSEQYRVLKPDGICLVLSSRRGINIASETILKVSAFENTMYERTKEYSSAADEKYAVCAYPMTEQELPQEMGKYGFRNISTHYITINLTPDSHDIDEKMAMEIIEANRQVNLDCISILQETAPNVLTELELKQWVNEINLKYDKRIDQYKNGEKLWDTNVSVIMVIRGVK